MVVFLSAVSDGTYIRRSGTQRLQSQRTMALAGGTAVISRVNRGPAPCSLPSWALTPRYRHRTAHTVVRASHSTSSSDNETNWLKHPVQHRLSVSGNRSTQKKRSVPRTSYWSMVAEGLTSTLFIRPETPQLTARRPKDVT